MNLRCQILLLIFSSSLLVGPSALIGDTIDYQMEGVLEEGGTFSGRFSVDTTATDQDADLQRGLFALFSVNVELENTTLFGQGSSGVAIDGVLEQDMLEQRILFDFVADSGGSSLSLAGFTFLSIASNDPNTAYPLDIDRYVDRSGTFAGDGGSSQVVDFQLTVVPEPSSITFAFLGVALFLQRRRSIPCVRQTA